MIVYAAIGGSDPTVAGIWRSLDTGDRPGPRMPRGNATDVVLDPLSGTGVARGGNLQIVYAAFGQRRRLLQPEPGAELVLQMLGTIGDPLIQDTSAGGQGPGPEPDHARPSPNGAQGPDRAGQAAS